jgi:hypothetical protein
MTTISSAQVVNSTPQNASGTLFTKAIKIAEDSFTNDAPEMKYSSAIGPHRNVKTGSWSGAPIGALVGFVLTRSVPGAGIGAVIGLALGATYDIINLQADKK